MRLDLRKASFSAGAGRLESAATAAMVLWALSALVQTLNYLVYWRPTIGHRFVLALSVILFHFPCLQSENLFVSLVVGLIYVFVPKRARCVAHVAVCLTACLLLLNQIVYKRLFDNLNVTWANDVDPKAGIGKLLPALWNWTDWLNIFTAAVIALVLRQYFLAIFRRHGWLFVLMRRISSPRCIVAILVVPLLTQAHRTQFPMPSTSVTLGHTERHPVASLVESVVMRASGQDTVTLDHARAAAVGREAAAEIYGLIAGEDKHVKDWSHLTSLQERLRRRLSGLRPNVVLIMLESVGARNIMHRNGSVIPEVAPNIAQLAESGVSFPNVFCTFPSSMRSFYPTLTGGVAPTWNDFSDVMTDAYTGPLLTRSFREGGYRTAFFGAADTNFENMLAFIRNNDFDDVFEFSEKAVSKEVREEFAMNSWGGMEEYPLLRFGQWLDRPAAEEAPFFAFYYTLSGHHPYDVPADYPSPFPNTDEPNRHKNAVHYTDYAVGLMVQALKDRALYENTVILICGDHGEAFGDPHPNNWYHKNFIYDENVRSFAIFSTPAWAKEGFVSQRQSQNGDLMPSLLALAGLPAQYVIGQDMFSRDFTARLNFHFKTSTPFQWGLRDGKWKYIFTPNGEHDQLFDTEADYNELENLEKENGSLLVRYRERLHQWYMFMGCTIAMRVRRGNTFKTSWCALEESQSGQKDTCRVELGFVDAQDQFAGLPQTLVVSGSLGGHSRTTMFDPGEKNAAPHLRRPVALRALWPIWPDVPVERKFSFRIFHMDKEVASHDGALIDDQNVYTYFGTVLWADLKPGMWGLKVVAEDGVRVLCNTTWTAPRDSTLSPRRVAMVGLTL